MSKTTLFLFLIIAFSITSCFHKNEKVTVIFDRVDGLIEGSSVLNRGITVGEVTRIDLFGKQVIVDIKLKDNLKIPRQSTFTIRQSLLGSSSVDIEYSNSENTLTSTDTAYGKYEKQAIMDNIISDTTKRKNIEKSLEKIATGIGELIESTKDTTKD